MKKKTDITVLKRHMKEWIQLPCIPNETFGGLFNNHPIIEVATIIDNTLVSVNDENINVVREQYIHQIEKCDDVYQLFMLTKRPYRLTLFQEVHEDLNENDFNSILNWVYKDIEFPNHNNDVEGLVILFEKSNPLIFMDEDDKRLYDSLPEQFEIYRGIYSEEYYDAVSWTTDINVAEWFANRFTKGYVAIATVNKADVFCCYQSEKEVVVNPNQITITRIMKADQIQDFKNVDDTQGIHNSFSWFNNK